LCNVFTQTDREPSLYSRPVVDEQSGPEKNVVRTLAVVKVDNTRVIQRDTLMTFMQAVNYPARAKRRSRVLFTVISVRVCVCVCVRVINEKTTDQKFDVTW